MSYKRILVPVDGSPTAAKGMKAAIRLARENRGKLMLLHVVEEYTAFIAPEVGASLGPILDSLRLAGKRTLARIAHSAGKSGAKSQSVLVENFGGRVADTIVQQADDAPVSCLAMTAMTRSSERSAMTRSMAVTVTICSSQPATRILC